MKRCCGDLRLQAAQEVGIRNGYKTRIQGMKSHSGTLPNFAKKAEGVGSI